MKRGAVNESTKYFESQDPDEKVIAIVRKHSLVLMTPFVVLSLFILVVITLYALLDYLGAISNTFSNSIARGIFGLLILYATLYSFTSWLIKYLDILILTNKHLVIIRQDGLFMRGVSVLDLGTIQDVATKQHGFIQTIFGFGKIDVQTAGEAPNFVYSGVANPISIQDAIMDAKEIYVKHNLKISSEIVSAKR